MIPGVKLDESRAQIYENQAKLYDGKHFEVFPMNIADYTLNRDDYISIDTLRAAIDLKVNLIWLNPPIFKFKNQVNQDWFDNWLARGGVETLRSWTREAKVYGDSPLKIVIEDGKVNAYTVFPGIWHPQYMDGNTSKEATKHCFAWSKDVTVKINDKSDEQQTIWLLEEHEPGQVLYRSFNDKTQQWISPRVHFDDTIVVDTESVDVDDAILTLLDTDVSLIFINSHRKQLRGYFGASEFSDSVVSKVKSIEKYMNLADFVIQTNSVPPLIVNKDMISTLGKVQTQLNAGANANWDTIQQAYDTFIPAASTQWLKDDIYKNLTYRQMLSERIFVHADARQPEPKFMQNNFDLAQLNNQSHQLFSRLMDELEISPVFWQPDLSTGAQSGIAYKRLMEKTIYSVTSTINTLEPKLRAFVHALLSIAALTEDGAGLLPEEPDVEFRGAILEDKNEQADALIKLLGAGIISQTQAIQQYNENSEAEADQQLNAVLIDKQKVLATDNTATNRLSKALMDAGADDSDLIEDDALSDIAKT